MMPLSQFISSKGFLKYINQILLIFTPVPTIVLGTGVKISKSVLTKNSHFLSKRNLSLENHEGAKLNTTEIAATAYLTRPAVLKHVQTLNSWPLPQSSLPSASLQMAPPCIQLPKLETWELPLYSSLPTFSTSSSCWFFQDLSWIHLLATFIITELIQATVILSLKGSSFLTDFLASHHTARPISIHCPPRAWPFQMGNQTISIPSPTGHRSQFPRWELQGPVLSGPSPSPASFITRLS